MRTSPGEFSFYAKSPMRISGGFGLETCIGLYARVDLPRPGSLSNPIGVKFLTIGVLLDELLDGIVRIGDAKIVGT
jgi:hypothetical protein